MATPDLWSLSLSVLILAGLQIGLPWTVGGRSPAGQASLVLLLALAGAIGLVLGGPGPRLRPSLPLCLTGILIGLSALHTVYPDRTIQSLLLLLSYVGAAALATHAAREIPWAAPTLLASVAAGGALVSLVGMIRMYAGFEVGLYANALTGPFGYPNAAGGYLLLTAGAALALARRDRRLVTRGPALAAALLSILGLMLTSSQGVRMAAAIGLATWAVLDRAAWWPRRRLCAGMGVIGLLSVLLLSPRVLLGLPLRLWSLVGVGTADTSFAWRLHILRWTWAMMQEHPWWGVGPGAYPVALLHYQRVPYVAGENPHNLYLELAAEYGLPVAILLMLVLGSVLLRAATAARRPPVEDPVRRCLAILVATLAAFLVHSAVDLDWSYPAVATTAVILLGLTATSWQRVALPQIRSRHIWQGLLIVILTLAAALTLSRYYASLLVTEAGRALKYGEMRMARQDLTWALRLNPLSFPAHQWMAWTLLGSGDPEGAIQAAERTIRIAPVDPNTHALAGEIASAAGRWDLAETYFHSAVDRGPYAHLRFRANLLDAVAHNGKAAEARWIYEQALGIFSPDRVLEREARCLAPGDRYLLARMSRRAARLYADIGDATREGGTAAWAETLAKPDLRGICGTPGRRGQTSPEASIQSFWRALSVDGWPRAEQFLDPSRRTTSHGHNGAGLRTIGNLERPRFLRIEGLAGGEREVRVRYEVGTEVSPGQVEPLCAKSDLRLLGDGWYLDGVPTLEGVPCHPRGDN